MREAMRARPATAVAILLLLGTTVACNGAESRAEPAPPAVASSIQRWKALAPATLQRTEVGAARIGRFIYVVGGFLPSAETTNAVELYDIERDRWRRIAPMPNPVNHPAVTSYRGRLYVFGGYTDSSFAPVTGALQRYDPKSGSWTLLANAARPRAAAALAALPGKLYAIGGVAGADPLQGMEVYDLSRARWSPGPSMKVAREHIAATVAGGEIYVFGGRTGSENLRAVERFDPDSGRWSRLAPLRTARSGIAAVTVRGRPVVFGGEELFSGGTTIRPVEIYEPESDRWRRLPGMRTPRHGLGGAVLGRRIYALQGGPSPGLAFSGEIEFLDLPRRLLR